MILNQIRTWCDYIDTMPAERLFAFGFLVLFVVVVWGEIEGVRERGKMR